MKWETTCKKCGKTLDGVEMHYGHEWDCSTCAEDQTDVLHAEAGCKVKAAHLEWGRTGDMKQAEKLLKKDGIYTAKALSVGGFSSTIELEEFPGEKFNTVHFVRVTTV